MLRVLIFIGSAVFAAAVLTYFLSMGGRLEATAFGQRFDIANGVAALLILFAVAAIVLTTSAVKDLASLPGRLRRREAEARRARGVEALVKGMEALAAGDASAARHQAKIAAKNLDEPAHTRLLLAQSAQLAGDEAEAGAAFAAMLEAPDTEFLGLKGLYAQAMRAGDKALAQGYAERAFRLRSGAAWAFESVLALGLDRGAWGETREAVKIAARQGLIPADKARRGEAALLAADAYAAEASGDPALALEEADAALKLAPGFAPAAALAARLHAKAGKRGRAAKILEAAFGRDPHPALAAAHDDLYADEQTEKRAEKMLRLAEKNPTAREGKLALARRAVLMGEHAAAIAMLEPLLIEEARARDCALMAEAVAGAYGAEGGEALARPWLRRAATAPRDPLPGAEGGFHFTREGWARLARDYMEHGRLAPLALETAPPGLSREELKLLTAPPAVDAAPAPEPAVEAPPSPAAGAAPHTEEPAAPADPPSDVSAAKTEADHAREIDAARKVS